MAIAKDADVYIFDEPLAGIDQKTKNLVMDAIFSRCADKTILIVLHGDMRYNERFDNIIDMEALYANDEEQSRVNMLSGID